MAITDTTARFLFLSKSLGVSFKNMLTIGRLSIKVNPSLINELTSKYHIDSGTNAQGRKDPMSPEEFFSILGSRRTDSIDYSEYEGATIIHDMNKEVTENMFNQYSVVIDGGSLEHIFNFPTAIRNCMMMVKQGGHFISFAPLNNLMGHGFYQFSPELFFRVFTEENGFKIIRMYLVASHFYNDVSSWYTVTDPEAINERVQLTNAAPVYLLFLAEKIKDIIPFRTFPNQVDYIKAWEKSDKKIVEKKESANFIKGIYRKLVNEKIRYKFRKIYNRFVRDVNKEQNLEKINKKYFRKYKIKNN
jgi:2-polyprenyl-3-methyl-5-hydroxy-6-metoxy-1,4-benzoquinol methylase